MQEEHQRNYAPDGMVVKREKHTMGSADDRKVSRKIYNTARHISMIFEHTATSIAM